MSAMRFKRHGVYVDDRASDRAVETQGLLPCYNPRYNRRDPGKAIMLKI